MSRGERQAMISSNHPGLSLSRQCGLLSISRSSFYYVLKGESPENLKLMRRIDEPFLKYPFYGSRQMVRRLRREDIYIGRHRVRRLMRLMGLQAIYQAPRSTPGTQDLSVFTEEHGDQPPQSGLVCRHHLHSCSTRVPVPGRNHGLGHPSCSGVAVVEHHGCRVLR